MTGDNLFDRLGDLFRSSGPVNWRLGREIAESVAGEPDPVEPWLAEEYRELAMTAGLRIAAVSTLDPAPGEVQPLDRRTWAAENVKAFAYLAETLADKMSMGPTGSPLESLGPALLGMQMGSVVGFMSHRVMGTFDIGLPPTEPRPISFIVPNIEAFAAAHDLDPRQVRLWTALHEVAHNAGMETPWVQDHLHMLIHQFVDAVEIDPSEISRRMEWLQDPETLQRALDDPAGFTGLLSGEGQREPLERMQALAALLDGYAEYLVDRSAPGLIPEGPRIRRHADDRRTEPAQDEQILHQVLGLELRRDTQRLGATFCQEVDRRWGYESLARVWEGPEMLPSLAELDDAVGWAARVLL